MIYFWFLLSQLRANISIFFFLQFPLCLCGNSFCTCVAQRHRKLQGIPVNISEAPRPPLQLFSFQGSASSTNLRLPRLLSVSCPPHSSKSPWLAVWKLPLSRNSYSPFQGIQVFCLFLFSCSAKASYPRVCHVVVDRDVVTLCLLSSLIQKHSSLLKRDLETVYSGDQSPRTWTHAAPNKMLATKS